MMDLDLEKMNAIRMATPEYNPDRELNIDALLACAFARSQKMMRYIAPLYDSDKNFFYKVASKNDHFSSRFVTGNRLGMRLKAIQALAIITYAKENETTNRELFAAAERAFKPIATEIKKYADFYINLDKFFESAKLFESSSDDNLHDGFALLFYFAGKYNAKINDDNTFYRYTMPIIQGKDEAFLLPFSEVMRKNIYKHPNSNIIPELEKATMSICRNAKTIADLCANIPPYEPENILCQTLWDFAQLDNIPMSCYENETFTKKEIDDIFNVIYLRMLAGNITERDINSYYIMGIVMRSFARLYKEALNIVDEYAGIIRETDNSENIQRDMNALSAKVQEQSDIIQDKQNKLNELQLKLNKAAKQKAKLEEQLAAAQERSRILESMIEDDEPSYSNIIAEEAAKYDTSRIDNTKALVFGGPPNWQNAVSAASPAFTCIPVTDKDFNLKLIDRADVIIFKTDYLSHAQWYRIMKRAKAKKKKIIYCKNNIGMLIEQVAGIFF